MRRVRRMTAAGLVTLGMLAAGLAIVATPALAAPPEAPEAISPAKAITATSVTLEGILNPHKTGEPGRYLLAYGPGNSSCYGNCSVVGGHMTGNMDEKVKGELTGLQPNQEYTFFVDAINEAGEETQSQLVSFTTLRAAPEVEKVVASSNSTEATLQAQIDPNNEETEYTFEYSTKATGETLEGTIVKIPGASPLEGTGTQVSVATGVLPPGANYFYRVMASNTTGTTSGAVKEFATVPTPVTGAVTGIGGGTATFNGHLKPLNEHVATQYHFDYKLGSECTGESSTPSEEAGTGPAGESEEAVAVTGLQPEREYTVCFVTSNALGGEATGAPETFTTLTLPPAVDHESVSGLTPFAATVETQINPNNQLTLCEVKYGTEPTLATSTSTYCETSEGLVYWLPGVFGERSASVRLKGLEADTTYYYRVVANAVESKETGEGAIQSFRTVGQPRTSTGEAQSITRVTAALSGTIDPERGATAYHFVYIDQAAYEKALAEGAENPYAEGATTVRGEAPAGESEEAVQPLIATGLLPETTYHYALVATNEAGSITGQDETFTTGAATPPIVRTGDAGEITMGTATISGTLDARGLDASYAFEVSTEPANPGPPSGGGSIGAGTTEASVSVALQGLQPGTTYYYRVLASSTDGTSYGEIKAFTTPGFPPPLTLPVTPVLLVTPSIAFPTGSQENTGTSETKTLTNAQRLANALKACKKDKSKSKRKACEKAAHKRYGPAKRSKKKGK
jgi:phosphodiesterase/alkaline phosphatase D-like protein